MAIDIIKLGTPVYFDYTAVNGSGFSSDLVETPKFWVFKDNASTGVSAALHGAVMSFRTGFQGHYYGNFSASTGNGFTADSFYNVITSGKIVNNGVTGSVYTNPHTFYIENYSFDDLALATESVYYADISLDRDGVAQKDEWSVVWYTDGIPRSGYSTATLRVIKRDGTDLFNVSMSGVGTGYIGARYDATSVSETIIDGESYIALTTALIDGVARTGAKIISRDNAVS